MISEKIKEKILVFETYLNALTLAQKVEFQATIINIFKFIYNFTSKKQDLKSILDMGDKLLNYKIIIEIYDIFK
jgi:hypothetical protein